MKHEEEFVKSYYTSMASFGQELFTEFLSDLTRKRQGSLLITSVIVILISFTLIKPIEATVAGVKINFLKPQLLPILFGAVCLYFLITYSIGVLQDWEYHEFRRMPTLNTINEFRYQFEKSEEELPDILKRLREQADKEEESKPKEKGGLSIDKDLYRVITAKRAQDLLEATEKKYNRLNQLKLFFEVVFPIGLALFAIGSAVWAGFLR